MSETARPALQQINLFNPELLPQPVVFPPWQALAVAGLVFVLLFGSGLAMKNRAEHTEGSNSQLENQLKQLKQQISEQENLLNRRKPDSDLVQQVEQLEEQQKNQQHTLDLLHQTSRDPKTGFAETLRALARQRLEGLWLTEIQLLPGQRILAGRLTQPELLPRWLEGLSREASFQGESYQVMEITPPDLPDAAAGTGATAGTTSPLPVSQSAVSTRSGPYHFRLATELGKTGGAGAANSSSEEARP